MGLQLRFAPEFARNPHYRIPPLAHEIPLGTVRDNVYVLQDGSMAAVYRVQGMEYDLAGDRDIATFSETLRAIINTIPPNVQLKLLHRITHTVRDDLEAHDREMTGSNHFARWIAWDQARRFNRAAQRQELLASENVFVVTYNPAIHWWEQDKKLDGLRQAILQVGAKESVLQRSASLYTMALHKFEEIIGPLVNQMRLAQLQPERLDDRALYALAWDVLNPDEALRRPVPDIVRPSAQDPYRGFFATNPQRKLAQQHPALTVLAPVTEREQLVASDWVVGDKWVKIGSTFYGAVTLRHLPTHHYPGLALRLAAIPFECTVSLDFIMLAKQRELEKQWRRVRSAKSKAEVALFGATPDPAKREAAADQEKAYLQLAASDENPLRFRMVIVVGAKSPQQLTRRCDAIVSLLRSLEGAQGLRSHYDVPDTLKTTWPFAVVSDLHCRKVMTSQAANLLPIYSRWQGSDRAVTLCMDPMRRLVRHDPLPGNLLSRNKVVTGMSGSGKSFMTQILDVQPQAARDNCEILIVESGGSFELTTRCFGGQYIRLGPRNECHINPFDLPLGFDQLPQADQEAELRYKLGFIKNLVLVMARLKDAEIQQLAENVVGTVVQRVYGESHTPRFRDFYRLLGQYENPKDPRAEELAGRLRTLLANYVVSEIGEEGMYAHYFDTYTSVNADCAMLDFDLIDVKNDPALLKPYSLVVIGNLIYNRLMLRDGKERMVIIDEGWAFVKEENGEMGPAGQLIELFWRESRKLGGSCTFITQNYADCTSDKIGRAILGNSTIQSFLVHERSGANDVAFQSANFSTQKASKVYSLRTEVGKYSEVMIKEGTAWGILRVPVVGPKYWLATSHHEDLAVRKRYFQTYGHECGLPDHAVVALLAEDYPGGVHAPHGEEMSRDEGIRFARQWLDHYHRFCVLVDRHESIPHTFT